MNKNERLVCINTEIKEDDNTWILLQGLYLELNRIYFYVKCINDFYHVVSMSIDNKSGVYALFSNVTLEKHFIPLAEWREQQIKTVLDE